MSVRVLRLMEYTYPDLESAHADMDRWYIQGARTLGLGEGKSIRSTVILNPTPFEEPLPAEADNG